MQPDSISPPAGEGVPLDTTGRYRLFPEERLPHLDVPGGTACFGLDAQQPGLPLYGLVLTPAIPHRRKVLRELLAHSCPGQLALHAAGEMAVPEHGRRFCVLLDRPNGGSLADVAKRFTETEILSAVLPPLLDALDFMEAREITHRAVHPANIFFLDREHTTVGLGPCFAGPPGLGLPAAYEPLERAGALPEARGEGGPASDWYALGVVAAGLLTGTRPETLADPLRPRLVRGSCGALIEKLRISPHMDALLTGLLHDDPEQRWGAAAVRQWRGGAWTKPRWTGERKAPRALGFAGEEFRQPRLLVLALTARPNEALNTIRDPAFEIWVRHNLGDAAAADRIHAAVALHAAIGSMHPDGDAELLARVCRALDPAGPLRFRDLALMRDGLGPLLAKAMLSGDRERLKALAALLAGPLLTEPGAGPAVEPRGLPHQLALALRGWVRDAALGAGLERCLYELNPDLPCQSPLLDGGGEDIASVLAALERAVGGGRDPPRLLLDRHVAAFLAARSKYFERRVALLARLDGQPARKGLAMVALFAELQHSYLPEPLHGLTAWAAGALSPAIDMLRSRSLRRRLREAMPALAESGDLRRLLQGLGLEQAIGEDQKGHAEAMRELARLDAAARDTDAGAPVRAALAFEYGRWLAAVAAAGFLVIGIGHLCLRLLA